MIGLATPSVGYILYILVCILLNPGTAAGIGGVHFGIVTTVSADTGNITPPFGLNLFVASVTFDKPYVTVVRAVLPWLAPAPVSLMLITDVPYLSLWIPRRPDAGVR